MELTSTHEEESISHFVCRMLYSRDLKNHDIFVKMEKIILEMRLIRLAKNENKPRVIEVLKKLIEGLIGIKMQDLDVTKEEYYEN